MSAYHDIFVRSKAADTDLVADVGRVLGTQGKPSDYGDGFVLTTAHAFVDVYRSHELEDDGDLPFSSYPLSITIRDIDRDKKRSERLARVIAGYLVQSKKYDCFIVYNTTELVAPPVNDA